LRQKKPNEYSNWKVGFILKANKLGDNMNNEKTNQVITKEVIKTAYEKQIKVHLVLTDRTWRNGFVTNISSADFFYFKDTENPEEVFFYAQIAKVEPYNERGGK